jgi:hypothetical protein
LYPSKSLVLLALDKLDCSIKLYFFSRSMEVFGTG